MHLNKIYISPFVPLFVIFCLLFSRLEEIMFLYLFGLVHELGHVFAASLFKVKWTQISFSIIGFNAGLEDLEYRRFYQQIIIYFAGPLTFFISLLFIMILKVVNVINLYEFNKYFDLNLTLNLFNLLPIFPLDGGRILDAIYRKNFPVKECFKHRKKWTIISLIPVILSLILAKQYVFTLLFMIIVCLQLFSWHKNYEEYLKNRLMKQINFEPKIILNNEIYHFSNNISIKDNCFVSEKEKIIQIIIKESENKHLTKNKRKLMKKTIEIVDNHF